MRTPRFLRLIKSLEFFWKKKKSLEELGGCCEHVIGKMISIIIAML